MLNSKHSMVGRNISDYTLKSCICVGICVVSVYYLLGIQVCCMTEVRWDNVLQILVNYPKMKIIHEIQLGEGFMKKSGKSTRNQMATPSYFFHFF